MERQGKPLILHGVFRAREKGPYVAARESFARSSALEVIGLFPIPFLLVGFVVLFLRLEEPTAWLIAVLRIHLRPRPDHAARCFSASKDIHTSLPNPIYGDAWTGFLFILLGVSSEVAAGSENSVVEMDGRGV